DPSAAPAGPVRERFEPLPDAYTTEELALALASDLSAEKKGLDKNGFHADAKMALHDGSRSSKDNELRRKVVWASPDTVHATVLPELTARLNRADKSKEVFYFRAIAALGNNACPAARDLAEKLAHTETEAEQLACLHALGQLGASAPVEVAN